LRINIFKKTFLYLFLALIATLSCGGDYSIHKEVIEVIDPPPTNVVVDYLIQATLPEQLDVLVVLDTSGSMNDDFKNVSVGLEILRGDIETITMDYRIGFINTSFVTPYFQGPIDSTSDILDLFMAPYSLGNDNIEAGFGSYYSFYDTEEADDFFRDSADKLIIFVSDEDEQSGITAGAFHSWLGSIYSTVQHDVVAITQIENGLCGNNYSTGDKYIELVTYYGKTPIDLCSDWTAWLGESTYLFKSIDYINLTKDPIEESLIVYLDGVETEAWYYLEDQNTVYLDDPPGPGVLVEVGYVTYDE
jgi:hypothetical protein